MKLKYLYILILLFFKNILVFSQCSITATDFFGNTSGSVNCGAGGGIFLQASALEIFETTSYKFNSQPYNSIIPYDQGTPLSKDLDNTFSEVIPMPFNFCFYNNYYNKLVISPNGFITFDTIAAGLASNPNFSVTNPNTLLPNNSIFGVMQDLAVSNSDDSEIYYSVVGAAPCRKFVINFYKMSIVGCSDTVTFQIVLSEFTNEIDINIENKPIPCSTARFDNSLIGIMNQDGTAGISPTSRNTGIWQAANESWKFSPDGNEIAPTFSWINSSNVQISSSQSFTAYPTKDEVYTVKATYYVCNSVISFSDDIPVTYSVSGTTPIINTPIDYTKSLCDNNADDTQFLDFDVELKPLITTDPSLTLTYYNSETQAQIGGAGFKNIVKEGNYTIWVRATNSTGCFSLGEIRMHITFLEKIKTHEVKKIFCFDGVEDVTVDLSKFYKEMIDNVDISGIKDPPLFFEDSSFAEIPDLTEAIDPIVLIEDDGDFIEKIYYVRFENSDDCYTIQRLKIQLINPILNYNTIDVCDFGNNGVEVQNLHIYDDSLIAGQPLTLTYFQSIPSPPESNLNALTTYTFTNPVTTLYVRLDLEAENGDCYRILPITFKLNQSPVLDRSQITKSLGRICDNNNNGAENLNLKLYESEIYSGAKVYDYTYYQNYDPATNVFSNPINNPQSFSVSQNVEVYVKVSEGACFSVAKINLNFSFLPTVIVKDAGLQECYKNFLTPTYNLDDAKPLIFDPSQNTLPLSDMLITYYINEDDANDGVNAQSNIQNFAGTITYFWARFESKSSSCYSVAKITLKNYLPPRAIASSIMICDNNLDGKPDVNLTLSQYTDHMTVSNDVSPENHFTFYKTLADISANNPISNPENYIAGSLPETIWVRVENLPGCYDSPATVSLTPGSVTTANSGPYLLSPCDLGNDLKETIDIAVFESQILSGGLFSYYETMDDLQNYREITTPKSYNFDANMHSPEVFVKVTDTVNHYCPTFVKITIDLKKNPKFQLSDFYYFCPEIDLNTGQQGSVLVNPDVSGLSTIMPLKYTWQNETGELISQNSSLIFTNSGKYSLTITANNSCSFTKNFEVLPYEVPIINNITPLGASSFQVNASGSKKILYSKDAINWQSSNIFENVSPGLVTFYVRFENENCLGLTMQSISVEIKNLITPNQDGSNDKWIFENLSAFKDVPSRINIYDRNGLMLFQQSSTDHFEWDGKTAGKSLPSASYWYVINLADGRVFTGWILLKNRN